MTFALMLVCSTVGSFAGAMGALLLINWMAWHHR